MKTCAKCKAKKELSEFYKDRQQKDGFNCYCQECRKDYYKNNKDKIDVTKKAYNKANKDKVSAMK